MFHEKLTVTSISLRAIFSVISVLISTSSKISSVIVAFFHFNIKLDQILLLSFASQIVISTLPYSSQNISKSFNFKLKLSAMALVLIPVAQFFFELVFGTFFVMLEINLYWKLLICYLYPFFIGLFKASADSNFHIEIADSRFETEELFEFYSFLTAALPFRYIYFSFSDWLAFMQSSAVKFSYKLVMHILMPLYSVNINSFKQKLPKCKKNETSQEHIYFIPGQNLPGKYSEFIEQIQLNFTFHQFNDIFDTAALIVLMTTSYFVRAIQLGQGFASEMEESFYFTLLFQFSLDLVLEIIFCVVAYQIVKRRYTQNYSPISVSDK